jgi:hypothetical protein
MCRTSDYGQGGSHDQQAIGSDWTGGGVVRGVSAERDCGDDRHSPPTGLVREVRIGTADFRDLTQAMAAEYRSTGSCVSGPQEGAMGIHFANGALIDDPALDPQNPELLIYEQRGDRLRLVGVEFLVLADAWDAANSAPPVLMGQHFHFVGAPNGYGLPPFYELHVWAWRENTHGTFVDWNPAVSCDEYTGDETLIVSAGHTGH